MNKRSATDVTYHLGGEADSRFRDADCKADSHHPDKAEERAI
jgi:hypothetical protein